MEKVTFILSRKERHFHTVKPSCSVSDAIAQMNCENVDYLVVMDDNNHYIGLLSEHDVASRFNSLPASPGNTPVRELMNSRLPVATTDDTVETCMRLMRQFQVRHLPVFEDLSFMGVVTADDILDEAVHNRANIFDAPSAQPGGAWLA